MAPLLQEVDEAADRRALLLERGQLLVKPLLHRRIEVDVELELRADRRSLLVSLPRL